MFDNLVSLWIACFDPLFLGNLQNLNVFGIYGCLLSVRKNANENSIDAK